MKPGENAVQSVEEEGSITSPVLGDPGVASWQWCVSFTWKSHCIYLHAGGEHGTELRAHTSSSRPTLPHFLSQSLPEIRVRKGSRTEVWSCSQTRWVPCLSPRQPPQSGLICDYLANVSPTWMHTAQEVQNTIPFRCVITGTYGRHRVQFPTQKISHCWESKLHITFLCKSDGKFGLGKFSHLKICKFTAWL